jgi:cytochrome b561/polyisoprenoid-binding protein YceI
MTDLSVHRYGGVAQAFHWLIALLIFVMYGLGWYMADLEFADPNKFRLYQIHKSIGITILVLALLRLGWRLTHRPPPYPETMSGWERLAASGAHWALYALILLQPFLGILQSNAANFPIVFWGGYELPALIAPNEIVGDVLLNVHHLMANVLAGLVLLHIGAALRHHIMLKDNVLRQMLPGTGLGAAVVVIALAMAVPPFMLTKGDNAPSTSASAEAPADPSSATETVSESVAAAAGDAVTGTPWTVEEGSVLGFIATQQGSAVEGSFEAFDASIIFDPDDLANSRLDVDIDVTTITTGHSDRDKTLNSPSFFDTATWPSAAFKSSEIVGKADGQYEAIGTLTIRDVTKDVVLPFTLDITPVDGEPGREQARAKGDLPILRLDYGVGQGDWTSTTTVADEVVITIDIQASREIEG